MTNQGTRWTLITATVLPFACGLVYYSHDRLQRRQTLEGKSILIYESSAESKRITARLTAKDRLADEVIAGRLSLLQAAAGFRDIDKRWPSAEDPRKGCSETTSADEGYCLKVIGYVDRAESREQSVKLAERLHAELDALLRKGTLRLPDSEDAHSRDGG